MYEIENKDNAMDIYISGSITDDMGVDLALDIRNAIEAGVEEITYNINSLGGSVQAAWDIISAGCGTEEKRPKIKAINSGFAYSAAAVLLASADESYAYDYSSAMIHNPLFNNVTLEDTEDGSIKEMLTKVRDGIVNVLKGKMKKSQEEIEEMMKRETSMNAKEQLDFGLVDEIIYKQTSNSLTESEVTAITNNANTDEKFKVFDKLNKKERKMKEVINYLNLDENTSSVDILNVIKDKDAKIAELEVISNKIEETEKQLSSLTIENFILKNSLEEKEVTIKNAVEKHGISVLETIVDFLGETTDKIDNEEETKVDELPTIDDETKNEILNIVNDANAIVENITDKTNISNELAEAFEFFGIGGDETALLKLKKDNVEKYNRLKTLFENNIDKYVIK